ncbi:PilN domain-containing protein [Clostridium grantii]|uniref:Type IV pilus assembly protein PilN n=1 Tax=Clostridium grantii DSM 8605 TaxID=1121316 RepID=A0A1M5RIC6_9CLOT|nr:PilN domain-containing protein [Clostridium grantii]SHH26001.1 type IV pilus assembly protein PilN [Clostridium grantii DSM 8605]
MKDFNFFGYLLKKQKSRNTKIINGTIVISAVVIAMITVFLINLALIKNLEKDIEINEKLMNYESYDELVQEIGEKQSILTLLEQYNNILEGIEGIIENGDNINEELMVSINNTIPREVTLEYINLDGEALYLNASSTSRQSIAEFQHNLKDTGLFESIHINNISSEEEVFSFDVEAMFKEVSNNE